MPRRRPPAALTYVSGAVVAVVVASSLAGCGDGGTGLDRGEVVARGDRICREVDDRIQDLGPPGPGDDEALWLEQVAEIQEDLLEQLLALRDDAPPDVADELEPALAAIEAHAAALRAGSDAGAGARGGGDQAARDDALARAEEAAARASRAFAAAGFDQCGRAT